MTLARWENYRCRKFIVSDHGTLLFARTIGDGAALSVRASVILYPYDAVFNEVDDYCRSVCWSEQHSTILDDRTMTFHRCWFTILDLYPDCPGVDCDHRRETWSQAYASATPY
ncbi:hypothetical protein WIS52_11830 [Pseudonocardia nematodicida]|uniref:Uncharacterized protein n=1 Tax=Pseudonocardia nematodicida TaxID=1206997 RepID=A0ABV1K9J6_9PSEU